MGFLRQKPGAGSEIAPERGDQVVQHDEALVEKNLGEPTMGDNAAVGPFSPRRPYFYLTD